MVIDLNVYMMFKIRFNLIVPILIGIFFTGCVQWPSFVIGDSSGYIRYDRNTRQLEVLWEKHVEVRDTFQRASLVDSIQDNTKSE